MYKGVYLLRASLLSGLLLILIVSCRKTAISSNNTTATGSSGEFSASVAGTSWTADSVSAILIQGEHRDKLLTITGYTSNRVITVSLLDTTSTTSADSSISVMQYLVGGWRTAAGFAYASDKLAFRSDSVWKTVGTARSGQATVTANDAAGKLVTGTFNFTAKVLTIDSTSVKVDSVVVTNGVFNNVSYVYKARHH
ncbi:MAG: hypothetical protein JST68_25080 [Bacteroidetes bacterium]|nr:hypothetical protein [Bacteroidota bacterium]